MEAFVSCLVEKKELRSPKNAICRLVPKMVEDLKIPIVDIVREVTKRWYCDAIGVRGEGLSGSQRRKAVKEFSKTGTKAYTIPSVKNTFITVDKECF